VKVFLSGDVMTGRGIDQVLPYPSDPRIHEAIVKSAKEYVRLAERVNGPIPYPVNFDYVWGAALDVLRLNSPSLYVVNLETAITRGENFVRKGINYRLSPENAECLTAACIDCCVLANNHILDWDAAGLIDTLATLERLGIKTVGAGRNIFEARAPVTIDVGQNRRVIVCAAASVTSGTPRRWAAGENAPGVNILHDLSNAGVAEIAGQIASVKRSGDIVMFSIHWGPNWGYFIPQEQIRFAHRLIDEAGVSVVFGHSSHHAKAIEWHRAGLILYGCGDFLNDYEGITGYEEYRDDLAVLYAITFDAASGRPANLELVPFRIRRFQLIRPPKEDLIWLEHTLDRESRRFGTRVRLLPSSGRLSAEPIANIK
jgi:poly-gamma-glutamate capsule biosynthesis protein CapA/YwtB (metallophosphatase superfamily)